MVLHFVSIPYSIPYEEFRRLETFHSVKHHYNLFITKFILFIRIETNN